MFTSCFGRMPTLSPTDIMKAKETNKHSTAAESDHDGCCAHITLKPMADATVTQDAATCQQDQKDKAATATGAFWAKAAPVIVSYDISNSSADILELEAAVIAGGLIGFTSTAPRASAIHHTTLNGSGSTEGSLQPAALQPAYALHTSASGAEEQPHVLVLRGSASGSGPGVCTAENLAAWDAIFAQAVQAAEADAEVLDEALKASAGHGAAMSRDALLQQGGVQGFRQLQEQGWKMPDGDGAELEGVRAAALSALAAEDPSSN